MVLLPRLLLAKIKRHEPPIQLDYSLFDDYIPDCLDRFMAGEVKMKP